MSDNIPFELQSEIINRVHPVKSLIRFRSVSKQWKSLIDSSEFITHHTLNHYQPQHLLVSYITRASRFRFLSDDKCSRENKYASIVDDDSFPHHKFSPVVPPTVKLRAHPIMLDCSHGLVCLHGWTRDRVKWKKLIVVWNPLIRKSVCISIPDHQRDDVIGFGVCRKTSDPKIVKITRKAKAKVFTLSTGGWRSVLMNTTFKSLHFRNTQVVIDGVIYWLAYDDITDKLKLCSFDLASEEFGEAVDVDVVVPYYLVGRSRNISMCNISKINESLIVLTPDGFCDCNVWMMLKNGVSQPSFTKLFTLTNVEVDSMIGFRKNGQPIMDHSKTRGFDGELEVYEPCSKRINGLGIYGSAFVMTSYTESLLLLNHSDSVIQ